MGTTLITGIGGGLAQLVARKLHDAGKDVVGVDYRKVELPADLSWLQTYRANYNKTAIEDVFKRHPCEAVLHLGRVGNLKESLGKRFDLNVVGSQKLMNLVVQHGIKKMVVLSTFHIYGAHPANHIPIAEGEPLRAGGRFPQLADAIQLDNMASTWVYQHPEARVVVLRPTNVIGPSISNAMSTFLRQRMVPHLLGFNPMVQFVHEEDLSEAIVRVAGDGPAGIYNVAGEGTCPWRTALELAEARTFPIPSGLVSLFLRGFSRFPEYLINFFKYPCIITDALLRERYGWAPRVGMREAIWSTVAEARAQQAAAASG